MPRLAEFDKALGRTLWCDGVPAKVIAQRLGCSVAWVNCSASNYDWPYRRPRGVPNAQPMNSGNVQRCEKSAAQQLARLEAALRLERHKAPKLTRCEVCGGRQRRASPHQHGAAA